MTISMTSVLRAIVMDSIRRGKLDYLEASGTEVSKNGSVVTLKVKREKIREILNNQMMKINPTGDDSFEIEVHPKSDFFEG